MPAIFDAGNPTIWPSSPGQIELTLEAVDGKLLDKGSLQDIDGQVSPYYRIVSPKPASTTLALIKETPIVFSSSSGAGQSMSAQYFQAFLAVPRRPAGWMALQDDGRAYRSHGQSDSTRSDNRIVRRKG